MIDVSKLPVKVMYEYITCQKETPIRCRKRATVYMDGAAVCTDHVNGIAPFLLEFAKRIQYKVTK